MTTLPEPHLLIAGDDAMSIAAKERDPNMFYNIVSEYTAFDGDELCLNYQYFKTSVVGSIDWVGFLNYAKVQRSNGISVSQAISQFNDQNSLSYSSAKQDMITLIIRLYIAEDGRNTISQLNNKIMNLRTKNTLPFTYLFKNGVIEKTGSSKKTKSASAVDVNQNTNLKKKNQNIIKALTKFNNNRKLFETASHIEKIADYEFMSEPERWITAMIRRHGQNMTNYLDVCIKNMIKNFTEELEYRGMWNEIQAINSQPEATRIEVALRMMVQIVSSKADNIDNANNFAQAYYSVQEKRSGRYKEKWVAQQSRNIKRKVHEDIPAEQSIGWLMDEIMSQPVTQPATAVPVFLPDSKSSNVLNTFDQLLMTMPPSNTNNSSIYRRSDDAYHSEPQLQRHQPVLPQPQPQSQLQLQQRQTVLPQPQMQRPYTQLRPEHRQASFSDFRAPGFMQSSFY